MTETIPIPRRHSVFLGSVLDMTSLIRRPQTPSHTIRVLFGVLCLWLVATGVWTDTGMTAPTHDGQLWFPLYNRFQLPGNFRGWAEVNPRFGDDVSEIDQLLLRPAIGYQISQSFSIWQGYAWVTNYQPNFRDVN